MLERTAIVGLLSIYSQNYSKSLTEENNDKTLEHRTGLRKTEQIRELVRAVGVNSTTIKMDVVYANKVNSSVKHMDIIKKFVHIRN